MKFETAINEAESASSTKKAKEYLAKKKKEWDKDKKKHDSGLTGDKTGFTGEDGDADALAKGKKNWNPEK